MTPSQFLTVAGPASLFLGVLGFLEPDFTPDLWFDLAENVVHTGFGIVALFVLACSAQFQWRFVLTISLLTVVVAVGGLLVAESPAPNFVITNLEHPLDNALHLTFVIAGLIACLPKTRLVARGQ
ncbi:hypothetical protein K8942_05760 [Candidatus Peribacteria bacterium]|nr:MAG: hypothetical protein K8942_05760 [Candidatus Peribacteria bacterium]